jgi:hypothetical protein
MAYKFNPFTGKFDITDLPSEAKFIKNGNDLELWWKGQLMHIWTYVPPALVSGAPTGLLLVITNS